MKTLIVGTGIIGVIYGWALSQAGVDVTHFVRKGRKDQFKDEVTLDLLDERKGHLKYDVTKYALKCVEEISPSDGYELIIVPTNVHQTEDVLKTLAPVSGRVVFLIFSGNWGGTEFIDRLLPKERYLVHVRKPRHRVAGVQLNKKWKTYRVEGLGSDQIPDSEVFHTHHSISSR